MAFLERADKRHRKAKFYQDDADPTQWRAEFTIHDRHYKDDLGQWQDVDETLADGGALDKTCDKTRHRVDFGAGGARRWYPRRNVLSEYVDITQIQYYTNHWAKLNLPAVVWKQQGAEWDMANLYASITNNWRRIKTDFILKDASAPTRLRFAVDLVGLTLDTQTWALTSITDGLVWGRIDPPTAVDTNGDPVPVSATYDGSYIEWSVDTSAAVYPVTVDPTFTDGYGGDTTTSCDTDISDYQPTYNFGAYNNLQIHNANRKPLVKYILDGLSGTDTCNSATLYMYLGYADSNAQGNVNVYEIASANSGWIEGATNGAQAGSGEPCWNAKEADGSGGVTTAWAGSAGLSTAGTDYVNSSLGNWSMTSGDAVGQEYSTSLTASVVEGWFGQADNPGLLLIGSSTINYPMLASSEFATTGYRPKLVVDYTAGGGTPTLLIGNNLWISNA